MHAIVSGAGVAGLALAGRLALDGWTVEVVERVGLPAQVTSDNLRYLRTKRDRMGHDLPWLPGTDDEGSTR